jgi:hypothetical protein
MSTTTDEFNKILAQSFSDPGALVSEFKSGIHTSEFYVSGIALLIPVIAYGAQLFGYHVNTAELSASLAGLVPAVGYVVGRSWLKKSRVTAVAAVVASTPAIPADPSGGLVTPIPEPILIPDPPPLAAEPVSTPPVVALPVAAAPAISPLAAQIQAEVTSQVTAAVDRLTVTEVAPLPAAPAPHAA